MTASVQSKRTPPRVVIIGAGFAGLWAARKLAKAQVEIILIDRNNYHTFFPLLYQVGAAEIEPEQIAYPVRTLLRKIPGARFIRGEVREINFAGREVVLDGGKYGYDYLVIAAGSETSHFGIPGASEHTFGLKTLDDAIILRNHILSCFERADHEPDPDVREKLLTFAIAGSGPTGVEFAGALMELVKGPLGKDYPTLRREDLRIVLIDASARVLSAFPADLSAYSSKKLESMGIKLVLNAAVSKVTPDGVKLAEKMFIPSATVVWTAGVCGARINSKDTIKKAGAKKISVLGTLQVQSHPEVFIAGDLAGIEGNPLPMIAPVAIQQGTAAAENVLRLIRGTAPVPFIYRDRGAMVTIGRNAAIAVLGRLKFKGFIAWEIWLIIHLMNLIGFRNKILVMVNWAWDYLFFERGIRLILPACCDRQGGRGCVSGARHCGM